MDDDFNTSEKELTTQHATAIVQKGCVGCFKNRLTNNLLVYSGLVQLLYSSNNLEAGTVVQSLARHSGCYLYTPLGVAI